MSHAALVAAVVLGVGGSLHGGIVEDWNEAFLQAVRAETPPPCLVSRNLPMVHVAIHRAVRGAVAAGFEPAEVDRAALEAGELVFRSLFPSQAALPEEVRSRNGADGAVDAAVFEIARMAAEETIRERENDGSTTTLPYVPDARPGQWRRTPPNHRPPELPHWGKVRTWVIGDPAAYLPPPPPALDSAAYAAELGAVRSLGGRSTSRRTEEQTLIARFWADFSYTTSPPGHWNDIARAESRIRRLPTAESARLFAVLNVALADACVAVWHCKYHYNLWRPVTAIRRADEDGLPSTLPDPAWEPLLVTPPHPEYVSGHSGESGAGAAVLEHFFGTEGIAFEAESDDVKDVKRKFTSFAACAEEIAMSRVYGGIHYPVAGTEGLKMGRRVAADVLARFDERVH